MGEKIPAKGQEIPGSRAVGCSCREGWDSSLEPSPSSAARRGRFGLGDLRTLPRNSPSPPQDTIPGTSSSLPRDGTPWIIP